MSQPISELSRMLHNLLIVATIKEVDHLNNRVKCLVDDQDTGWIPHQNKIGNNFRAWSPLRVGTQVLLASPSGNLANAVIIQILNDKTLQPPEDHPHIDHVEFDDGTFWRYNSDKQELKLSTPGDIYIKAGKNISITADGDVETKAGGTLWHDAKGFIKNLMGGWT